MTDSSTETVHRYAWQRLRGDYIRAAAGGAFTGAILLIAETNTISFVILAAITAVFAAFGWRTWTRHATVVTAGPEAVAIAPTGPVRLPWHHAHLAWPDLRALKLSYYSTRRDKTDGWMSLTLRGITGRLSFDSSVEGFDRIARLAFDAARRNGVEMSQTTMTNFRALGIVVDPADDGWGDPAAWLEQSDADPNANNGVPGAHPS